MTEPIATVPNLRDLGGHRTRAGDTVRHGRLFRSTDLSQLSDDDLPRLVAMGLVTVVDLRTDAEREPAPDRGLPGARNVVLDVLADLPDGTAAQMAEIISDPVRGLGGATEQQLLDDLSAVYRALVTLSSAVAGYRELVALFSSGADQPLLFHCTTGKDRTGWAAAIVLSILDVPRSDIEADYERTNADLLPALQPMIDAFVARGGSADLLKSILGVRPEFLSAAFDEAERVHGSMDVYLAERLGVTADVRSRIQDALLDGRHR